MIEIMTGVLSGGRIADEITDLFSGPASSPQGLSHFLLAIDVSAAQPLNGFKARMGDLVKTLKTSQLAPGFDEVTLPGEREFRKERAATESGVSIARSVVRDLVAAAKQGKCPDHVVRAAFPDLV
jgi:LDH2 family malate/lactate/ureidoglycolate dehydrogenase